MRLLPILALAALATAVAAGGAGANGGGPVTIMDGGKGALAPSGKLRYVTLPTGRQTLVSVVRVRGGQVIRWRLVRGYAGIPVVALDGTTDGVSHDGRTLVLAGVPETRADGSRTTRFQVLDTGTLKLRRIDLRGSWSYDAISPDGATLYLVEYLAARVNAPYRVRMYDLAAWRLLPGALVDRLEREAVMRGRPVTRATSADGRWAYTLYARARDEPFVHALDTSGRAAFCIDLPLELKLARQLRLRLSLAAGALVVRSGKRAVARIDTASFRVQVS